ncbi:MAG: RnfH family protein [Halieaceae bacterium]|jgi:uncharacterized protein|nr:RnfH family protein [Halieaceae bacterium]
MTENQTLCVEVAYALAERQSIVVVDVAPGTTAIEAARQSGIEKSFDGLDLDQANLGIFGKAVDKSQVLQAGDRVEIYRPLLVDPKEVRRIRAAEARERRAKKKAG